MLMRWVHPIPALAFGVCLLVLGCSRGTPSAESVLAHRQLYSVTLKSWIQRDYKVFVEIEVVPEFEPEIHMLTVRIVGFDDEERESGSVRVALPVQGLSVGLATMFRREVAMGRPEGGVGVEVEATPAETEWGQFPELIKFVSSDGRSKL